MSLEQAGIELASLSKTYHDQFGGQLDANNLSLPRDFVDSIVGTLKPTFYTLLGAVGFVLLIACANVSSLFIGRLAQRQKEIAVRQSLGASRGAIVRQFLAESLIFSSSRACLARCCRDGRCPASRPSSRHRCRPTRSSLDWRVLAFSRLRRLPAPSSSASFPRCLVDPRWSRP